MRRILEGALLLDRKTVELLKQLKVSCSEMLHSTQRRSFDSAANKVRECEEQ
jgi:hypothetical protein